MKNSIEKTRIRIFVYLTLVTFKNLEGSSTPKIDGGIFDIASGFFLDANQALVETYSCTCCDPS